MSVITRTWKCHGFTIRELRHVGSPWFEVISASGKTLSRHSNAAAAEQWCADNACELDPERVDALVAKITAALRDQLHNPCEVPSPARVFEALNALASCSALVIAGANDGRAYLWFNETLHAELSRNGQ